MALLKLLLVSCISFHLLLVSALSDDSVSIKVDNNGNNSPKCLTGNGACQSLDYVFKNLKEVKAETVMVSIASPQIIKVNSTATNDGTTAVSLIGDNEDSSSKSERISIDFNSVQFNFPSVSVTFQGLEITNAKSLIFNCDHNSILFYDCSLTSLNSLTIKPTTVHDRQTKLTLNSSLVHDCKFDDSNGFLYYDPPGGDNPYYSVYIYLYGTNFTKNTGDIIAMVNREIGMSYFSDVRVENCIISENTKPGFTFVVDITTASDYSLDFNMINTTFSGNNQLTLMVGLTGGGKGSSITFNLIGLNITNNYNSIVLTGDAVFNSELQLSDSIFSNNDGLEFSINVYNCSFQASNVHFQGNKRWTIHVFPEQLPLASISVNNCTIDP